MDFDLPFNVEKQNQARRLKHMELELMEEQEKKRISNKEKQSLNYLDDENFAVDVQTKGKPNQANRSQTNSFLRLASREYSSVEEADDEYFEEKQSALSNRRNLLRNTSPQARDLPPGIKRPNPNLMNRNYQGHDTNEKGAGYEYVENLLNASGSEILLDSEILDEVENIMNSSLLGSQSTWRVPYFRFSGSCCFATFCPCIIMGQITTLIKREKSKYRLFNKFNLGMKGIQKMIKTAGLAILCPIPLLWPTLIPESRRLRSKIITIYDIETATRREEKKSSRGDLKREERKEDIEILKSYFLPFALAQEYKFLKQRVKTNTLRFPWETKDTWDIRSIEDLPVFKILFMGDNNVGKSRLFKRLLGLSFQQEEDIDEYTEDTTVNIGVRVFHDVEKCPLGSLELWDVPADEYTMVEDQVFQDFHVLILTFSWLRLQSFHYVKQIVQRVKALRIKYASREFADAMGNRLLDRVPIILCATKVDLFAKESSKFYKEVEEFLKEEGLFLVETSGRTGMGLGKLFKTILNSLVVVYKINEEDQVSNDFDNVSEIGLSNPIKPGKDFLF